MFEVTVRGLIRFMVYFALPYLSVLAYRRQWTEIALLDQWCDLISVAIMIAYTAIMVCILVRRGEVEVHVAVRHPGFRGRFRPMRHLRVTVRKCDQRMRQYFWWMIAAYPMLCTVSTVVVLIPRMFGRT